MKQLINQILLFITGLLQAKRKPLTMRHLKGTSACSRHVVSFEKNEKKYNDSLRLLGFVAIVTLGLDLTAPQALAHYKLRDEQEKYFQQMKTEMCSDR